MRYITQTATAAAVLGWGMYEFPQAYQATGTWAHAGAPGRMSRAL